MNNDRILILYLNSNVHISGQFQLTRLENLLRCT
jgi:hypothetical protein